jgi:sugar phosphate isomerase/epimerase
MSAAAQTATRLALVRSLWGFAESPATWAEGLQKVAQRGYAGIECCPHFMKDDEAEHLVSLLRENDLRAVAQCHSDPYHVPDAPVATANKPVESTAAATAKYEKYTPRTPRETSVAEHSATVRAQVTRAQKLLGDRLMFANLHSGCERWSAEEEDEYFAACEALERETGVELVHETHRGRLLFSPWNARDILSRWPALRVTADISHWTVVAHGFLDRDWDIVEQLARQTRHIHARVGTDQAPQVHDPRDGSMGAVWLEHHERVWDLIWQEQHKRGLEECTLVPEFGPPPYMPVMPHSATPVADLEDICEWMATRQRDRYRAMFGDAA